MATQKKVEKLSYNAKRMADAFNAKRFVRLRGKIAKVFEDK